MPTLAVDPRSPDPAAIRRAAGTLRRGGLVAFPTETVYGLGANALDPEAVARIFAAKGRPSYNPLIVHLADADAARALAAEWSAAAERLAERFWPGPLTLVVPRRAAVPDAVTAGLPSVALRVPAHPVAQALLREAGIPVAAPSANRSTEVSPTTAAHVERSLGGRVALILDGGPTPVGIESTVVGLAGTVPTLLRPGTVSIEELRDAVGPVVLPSHGPGGTGARPSPGMLDRHYAPRAALRAAGRDALVEELRDRSGTGGRTAVLSLGGAPNLPAADVVAMPRDAREYAARLYATLHRLDDEGFERILVELPPDTPEWAGVRDRLRRASHPG
ncbi:MAG TPA: L-threonylcarbamoyladenylate synthase [Longimicrobiaceae bacterium]|nr:L-threonylcarbamoyladenylate synthase [Longimicrobiaceae bacterium]